MELPLPPGPKRNINSHYAETSNYAGYPVPTGLRVRVRGRFKTKYIGKRQVSWHNTRKLMKLDSWCGFYRLRACLELPLSPSFHPQNKHQFALRRDVKLCRAPPFRLTSTSILTPCAFPNSVNAKNADVSESDNPGPKRAKLTDSKRPSESP